MQVTLTPVPVKVVSDQTITVDGIQIGVIKMDNDAISYKYHAVLKSKFNNSLYQGFGDTIDASLRHAIDQGKIQRHDELRELDELENAIWGDHEIHK